MPPLDTFAKRCVATAVLHALATPSANAATITVTSADDGPGSGLCTLRDAITTANTTANTGGCVAVGAFDSNDTINFDLPQPSTISLVSGPLDFTASYFNISAQTNGVVEIDAANVDAAFNLSDAFVVNLTGLEITGGAVTTTNSSFITISNSKISGNDTGGVGGGVFLDNCDFCEIIDSEISGNSAYSGGGVAIIDSDQVTIEGTTISNNTATGTGVAGRGGGVNFVAYTANAGYKTLYIKESIITGNTVSGVASGGGISAYSPITATTGLEVGIFGSKISNNEATRGGGISLSGLSYANLIYGTTISSNSARSLGGGLYTDGGGPTYINGSTISENRANSYGGAIFGQVDLSNSTISSNSATTNGSAIAVIGAVPTSFLESIRNSTITDNTGAAALFSFYGVANNINLQANNVISNHSQGNCSGFVNAPIDLANWVDDNTCGVIGFGDPKLGSLADNGGPTKTHAPLPGSGLAGAGILSECNAGSVGGIDQRGRPRGSTRCFIGAVEGIVDPSSLFVIPLPNGKVVVVPL